MMSDEQLTVASGVVAVLKTDRRLWGRVGEWLPERNRWVLTLPNGVDCAAREDQLEAVRLEPGVKVKVSLPQIEFPSAEVLYYLPERERWVILIEGGQEAAARGDQLTVLAPAGADVAASSEKSSTSSGCCKGNSASKPAQGCCKDTVEQAGNDEAGARTACGDAGDNASCGVTSANVWDGVLNEEMQALVELVAKTGLGAWDDKHRALAERLGPRAETRTAAELEAKWTEIAPAVEAKLREQPSMPCGNTCGTCPTKHDCHLEGIFDMEDYGKATHSSNSTSKPSPGKGTMSRKPVSAAV